MTAAARQAARKKVLWPAVTGDRSRQVLTLMAATGQVLLPTLWGPQFAEDEQPPSVISPAPYTFAVWLPIFASSLGFAGLQAQRTGRDSEVMRAVGWPLAGAFASTAVWAPLVRTGKYWSAQAALAAIAAFAETARRRVAQAPPAASDPVNVASTLTTGMLAAWGTTATGVNLASMLASKGLIPAGGRRTSAAVGLLLALGATGAAATSSTGAAPVSKVYAATVLWGLTGVIAGQRKRSPAAAVAAGAAMVPILFAATHRSVPDNSTSA